MSGAPSGGHAYGTYTDPEFPGVVWRAPGFAPAGKKWKPVKVYGTKTYRDQTDEEWRQLGTPNRGRKELFEEDPKGQDFNIRQQLVDIDPPETPAGSSTPDAAAPAAPAAPATLQSRRTTPTDTAQFGTESRLISAQRERERRSQTRRTRRPLLSQTPTLGPSGTLGV